MMNNSLTQDNIDGFLLDKDIHKNYVLKDGDSGLFLRPPNNDDADFSRFLPDPTWYMEAIDKHLFKYVGVFGEQSPRESIRIGPYPEMSLAQARAAYKEYLEGVIKDATEKLAYENTKGE